MTSVKTFIKKHKKLFWFVQYLLYWALNFGIDARKFLVIGCREGGPTATAAAGRARA